MIFSSILFLFRFLPVFMLVYFAAPKRMRNLVLFFGSLIFYAWGEPVYLILMLFSTLSDYIHGILIEEKLRAGRRGAAKGWLVSSLAVNLGMLGFFKYSGLAALPIGISFYTFQTMSYTIDVYRGKAKAQRDLIAFGAFVAMFPQLIAGPIVQYRLIAAELSSRRENAEAAVSGVRRFIIGLAKKVLLANRIGLMWEQIAAVPAADLTTAGAWLGAVCFGFQIYYDFSGYSDMAVGLGSILGFRFPENFRYPYTASSITDFWRRWHRTLGGWFRDYVYIPLGGNRKGLGRQIVNILIVWALTGVWHGASWNFLLWGLWFALFLVLEKAAGVWRGRNEKGNGQGDGGRTFSSRGKSAAMRVLGSFYTLAVVCVGWVIFALEDAGRMADYLSVMFGAGGAGLIDDSVRYALGSGLGLFLLLVPGSTPLPAHIARTAGKRLKAWLLRGYQRGGAGSPALYAAAALRLAECAALAALFLLSVAFIVDASYNPFLYFRF